MATTTTLWNLPSAPLPVSGIVDSTFMTIWLFVCLGFGAILTWLLRRTPPTWPDFRNICIGAYVLAFWYFFQALDRWLRFDQHPVKYYYIVVVTVWEAFRVISAILLLWGTFEVVWRELEGRFVKKQRIIRWLLAKVAIFLVGLVSFYYEVLYIALSVVWLDFRSLNSIADIATKRTAFEISTAAFLSAFCLMTANAARVTTFVKAREFDGDFQKNRILLFLATVVLSLRSLLEFFIILAVYGPTQTRHSTTLARDVSYGLLSALYLLLMTLFAWRVASPAEKGNENTRNIQSKIREYIDKEKLDKETHGGAKLPRPFREVLDEVIAELDIQLGAWSQGSTMSTEDNRQAALEYLQKLRTQFGHRDAKEDIVEDETSSYHGTSRPGSVMSFFGGRSLRSRVSQRRSSPNLFASFGNGGLQTPSMNSLRRNGASRDVTPPGPPPTGGGGPQYRSNPNPRMPFPGGQQHYYHNPHQPPFAVPPTLTEDQYDVMSLSDNASMMTRPSVRGRPLRFASDPVMGRLETHAETPHEMDAQFGMLPPGQQRAVSDGTPAARRPLATQNNLLAQGQRQLRHQWPRQALSDTQMQNPYDQQGLGSTYGYFGATGQQAYVAVPQNFGPPQAYEEPESSRANAYGYAGDGRLYDDPRPFSRSRVTPSLAVGPPSEQRYASSVNAMTPGGTGNPLPRQRQGRAAGPSSLAQQQQQAELSSSPPRRRPVAAVEEVDDDEGQVERRRTHPGELTALTARPARPAITEGPPWDPSSYDQRRAAPAAAQPVQPAEQAPHPAAQRPRPPVPKSKPQFSSYTQTRPSAAAAGPSTEHGRQITPSQPSQSPPIPRVAMASTPAQPPFMSPHNRAQMQSQSQSPMRFQIGSRSASTLSLAANRTPTTAVLESLEMGPMGGSGGESSTRYA